MVLFYCSFFWLFSPFRAVCPGECFPDPAHGQGAGKVHEGVQAHPRIHGPAAEHGQDSRGNEFRRQGDADIRLRLRSGISFRLFFSVLGSP